MAAMMSPLVVECARSAFRERRLDVPRRCAQHSRAVVIGSARAQDLPGYQLTYVNDFNGSGIPAGWLLFTGHPGGIPTAKFSAQHVEYPAVSSSCSRIATRPTGGSGPPEVCANVSTGAVWRILRALARHERGSQFSGISLAGAQHLAARDRLQREHGPRQPHDEHDPLGSGTNKPHAVPAARSTCCSGTRGESFGLPTTSSTSSTAIPGTSSRQHRIFRRYR